MAGQATGYIGEGSRIQLTAPSAGYLANEVVVVRSGATGLIGVVQNGAVAASGTAVVQIDGIFTLPKATGSVNAFSVGDVVYWDATDNNCQAVASANVKAGICVEAAVAADTTVKVKLIPSKA